MFSRLQYEVIHRPASRCISKKGRVPQTCCCKVRAEDIVMESIIDKHGFRPNVGIVLVQTPPKPESASQVLWARRIGGFNAWQFPQGGIHAGESPQDAVYRELHEEVVYFRMRYPFWVKPATGCATGYPSICGAITRRPALWARSRSGFATAAFAR